MENKIKTKAENQKLFSEALELRVKIKQELHNKAFNVNSSDEKRKKVVSIKDAIGA